MQSIHRELVLGFPMRETRAAGITSFAARSRSQFKILYRVDSNADRPYLRSLRGDISNEEIEDLESELEKVLSTGV
jgi:hypothetical protein